MTFTWSSSLSSWNWARERKKLIGVHNHWLQIARKVTWKIQFMVLTYRDFPTGWHGYPSSLYLLQGIVFCVGAAEKKGKLNFKGTNLNIHDILSPTCLFSWPCIHDRTFRGRSSVRRSQTTALLFLSFWTIVRESRHPSLLNGSNIIRNFPDVLCCSNI